MLLHVMRGLFTLLMSGISHNLEKLSTLPRVFQPLSNQHRRLMEAVLEGDPEKARRAAQAHLVFRRKSLHQIDREAENNRGQLRNQMIQNHRRWNAHEFADRLSRTTPRVYFLAPA